MPFTKKPLPEPEGPNVSVQKKTPPRKPQSDTARICAAYLALLDAIERYGGSFAFPMQANPEGDPRITYRNTLELQGFYRAIQLADYELPHMLRGDPAHKMIGEKRAAIKALLESL